jgi:hypothetical protein
MPAPARLAASLLPILLASACSDSDVVTIRVKLAADGSGSLSASSLSTPTEKAPFEGATKGAEWTERASLTSAKGTFATLGGLEIAGIRFTTGATPDGIAYVRATVPTGTQAEWCKVFAPSQEHQRKVSGTLDPTGRVTTAGSVLKLEIEVPGLVAAVGVAPELRGASPDKSKERAWMVLPIQRILESAEKEIVFDVTWRKR